MHYPKFIVSNKMEEYISIHRVKSFELADAILLLHMLKRFQ